MTTQPQSGLPHSLEIEVAQLPGEASDVVPGSDKPLLLDGSDSTLSATALAAGESGSSAETRCTKFKKGQSGNPRGRPRKAVRQPGTDLEEAFRREVTINQQGKPRAVSIMTAVIMKLQQLALAGDIKAAHLLFQHCPESVLFHRDIDTKSHNEFIAKVMNRLSDSALNEFREAARAVAQACPQLSPKPIRRRRKKP